MSITSDVPLKGTCCVCGKPVSVLTGALPPILPGAQASVCPKCGKQACASHIKEHTKSCGKIEGGNTDWCKTKGILS